jgi:hypothetical protein
MRGLWCALPSHATTPACSNDLLYMQLCRSSHTCLYRAGCEHYRNTLVFSTVLVGMQARDAELGAELLKIYRQGNVDSHKDFISFLEKERDGLPEKAKKLMPDP